MAVCAAYGIPHSVFASWDRDDRDKAVWFEIHKRETHGPCGTRPADWDEKAGGHSHAYVPERKFCEGCAAIAAAEKQLPKDQPGWYVVLERNTKAV